MPSQKLITIAVYAAVATSLGSATQADIQVRDSAVHARFDLTHPRPFPSDQFTEFDATNLTGRRVNLPVPDCSTHPDDCQDIVIINTLDGFNLQPRIAIPFDGPIDAATVTSETVLLLKLDDARDDAVRPDSSASIRSCGTSLPIRCTPNRMRCWINTRGTRCS